MLELPQSFASVKCNISKLCWTLVSYLTKIAFRKSRIWPPCRPFSWVAPISAIVIQLILCSVIATFHCSHASHITSCIPFLFVSPNRPVPHSFFFSSLAPKLTNLVIEPPSLVQPPNFGFLEHFRCASVPLSYSSPSMRICKSANVSLRCCCASSPHYIVFDYPRTISF